MKTKFLFALSLAVMLSILVIATTANAALPPDMSWVKDASNPVVASNKCYTGDHVRPALVVESSLNYKMYISPRGVQAIAPQVYLLTTSDGGLTWACANGGNPVLTLGAGGAWDDTRVEFVSVLKEGPGDYKMWYTGRNSTADWGIGYATSGDGVAWTKYDTDGGPVLTPGGFGAWDSLRVMEPTVIKVGGTYHMWYTGEKVFPYAKIGHATSADGITWVKDAGNPVFTGTAGTWDANEVYSPYVVPNTVDGSYEMFYSGENGNRWLTGHATSTDLVSWTNREAILSPSSSIAWEAGKDSLDYAGAVLDGTTWKVFYSLGGTYQVGLATLQATPQLTFNPLATSVTVGNPQVVTIDLTSVTGLYGYQFEVHYDATKVSATGAFVNSFFDTAGASIPDGWNHVCAAGVCKFAVSKVAPATAVSGSGTLAQITFTGSNPGLVTLTFGDDILGALGGASITHTTNTGYLSVYGAATVHGIVALQGRATPIDEGTVTLYDQDGIVPSTTVNFSAADGTWSATVPVYGSSTTFDIEASHSLYLTNRKEGVVVTTGANSDQGTTTLKGGDANNDGTIAIGDLTCVGANFGTSNNTCAGGNSDINGVAPVNILDLVLVGGNYGLSAPQPW